MVQLTNHGKLRPESELPMKMTLPLATKLEIEDPLEDEHGPLNKRSKCGTGESMPLTEVIQNNLLNEPSPLGLRLRKSPSLVDLIQMRLSQANAAANSCILNDENLENGKKNDTRSTIALANTEKLKASNFPASLLRIGTWEYVSRYEGDLVAKCYFAKRKLVWEILDGGLKSKIEIQWSDITALKATCPEDGPGTLDIVLGGQPLFFRETNPQPRKHTLWQATSDFTDGQASMHRRHLLRCPQGLLSKHFEKLIQCDPRLCALSHESDVLLDAPFSEPRYSVFEDHDESKCHPFDKLKDPYESVVQELEDSALTCASTSTSAKNDIRDPIDTGKIHSPSPVMESWMMQGSGTAETEDSNNQWCWDRLKVPGLKHSMSISDFVNQIGHCISEQISLGNPQLSGSVIPDKEMLEELAQCLFSDSQMPASDEKSVMSKVNSFCCLLQKDVGTVESQQTDGGGPAASENGFCNNISEKHTSVTKGEINDVPGPKAVASMSRKDSFGDLLMQLPRIASLPQFLFNITEDEEDSSLSS
ncbi:unnamed protein product [Musa textilis]